MNLFCLTYLKLLILKVKYISGLGRNDENVGRIYLSVHAAF